MVKIVSIGGGTGQSKLLEGLRTYTTDLSAIVAVTDAGRSTGIIRNEFDILAPGDIRNCLVALSNSPKLLKELFQFRFSSTANNPTFHGMNFGNLFITALTKLKNDNFAEAIEEVSKILKIDGKVIPSTLTNTQVCAKLSDGKVLKSEPEIARSYAKTKKISKIYLADKNTLANKDAIDAILEADLVVIGPGGLYTSVLVNLLPKGMTEAIKKTKAKKVYVANVATQQGVTDNLDLYDHVQEIVKYLGKDVLDYVLINNKKPPKKIIERYQKAGANYLSVDEEGIKKIENSFNTKVVLGDIISRKYVSEYSKPGYIRHNPKKLSEVLMRFTRKEVKGVILVAGKGTRMKPFSINQSKEMLYFLGKPLIARHADEMIKNGIFDITFICNSDNIDEIRRYFNKEYIKIVEKEQGKGFKLKFRFVLQTEQKGPVNAILYARDILDKSYFLIKYGDSLASNDQTKDILSEFNKDPQVDAVCTLRKVKQPKEYGIARFDKNKLVEIVEKPQDNFPSDLANVGLAIVNGKKFFSAVDSVGIKTVLPPVEYILRKKGKVSYWIFSGERVDVGRVWNILDAHRLLINKVRKKTGVLVRSKNIGKNVEIGKGVYIGKNAIIGNNVTIGDYSSIDGVIKDNCVINKSMIMKGSVVQDGSKISSSVIGENCIIGENFYTKVKKKNIEVFCKDKYVPSGKNSLGLFCASDVVIESNLYSEPGKMIFPNKIVKKNITEDLLLRAIVFDADNTVYNTSKIARLADMAAMKFYSGQTNKDPEFLYNYWKTKILSKVSKFDDPVKRHRKYSYGLLAQKFKIRKVDEGFNVFLDALKNNIELNPGFKEILPWLSDYKLALLTEDNSDLLAAKLKKFRLTNLFDVIINSNDLNIMKPSQAYFDKVISELEISPSECLFVGDNFRKDLAIPKKHGANVVLFSYEQKKEAISNFLELKRIVGNL